MADYKFHWLNPKIEPGASPPRGDGLFAMRKLKQGERLLMIGGYILSVEEESRLPGRNADNGVQITEDLVLCTVRPEEWGGVNFVNHSCEPNAGFNGQIELVAMRDIAKGEEIAIDYAMVRIPMIVTGCTDDRDRWVSADAWCSNSTPVGHDDAAQGCP